MLLREDVVLGRAARVPPAAGRAHVGVARQGVGGGCLGGHRSLRRRRCWQYLSCAARPTAGWWIFFNDFAAGALRFHRNPLPRALMCSVAVRMQAAAPAGVRRVYTGRQR